MSARCPKAFDSQTRQPIVNFRFNIRGAQRFGQATTENLGRQLAIVLDNRVISAPTIQSPITGGSGQISGSFTVEQVNNLAVLLRSGALPAKLTIVEERTVGPGLGRDSIEAGKTAVKYKDVNIGQVTTVRLSDDYSKVEVTAKIAKSAGGLMVEDAKFWVVEPRVTLSGVSGLGTLLSGNYIGFEVGKSDKKQRRFTASWRPIHTSFQSHSLAAAGRWRTQEGSNGCSG